MAEKMTPEETLAFFASVIKSGEGWTATCQQAMDDAMGHIAQPAQAVDVATNPSAAIGPLAYSYRDCLKEANRPTRAIGNAQTLADAVDPLVIRLHDVTAKLEAANALLREVKEDGNAYLMSRIDAHLHNSAREAGE
jgi:hypothetical protein